MPRLGLVRRRKFEQFLKFSGCSLVRIKGDHIIYGRAGMKRPVVFPYDKEISPFVIRNNLRTLGMSVNEFLEIVNKL